MESSRAGSRLSSCSQVSCGDRDSSPLHIYRLAHNKSGKNMELHLNYSRRGRDFFTKNPSFLWILRQQLITGWNLNMCGWNKQTCTRWSYIILQPSFLKKICRLSFFVENMNYMKKICVPPVRWFETKTGYVTSAGQAELDFNPEEGFHFISNWKMFSM